MHFHSLSFAFRAFRKQKMYVAITAIGLSLALGASLLILSFVNFELSFEKCHENSPDIYRVGGQWTKGDLTIYLTQAMYPLGPALKEALPEVREQVRLGRFDDVVVKTDRDREFKEAKFLMADPSVFSVFSIPLIQGDSQSVLSQPYSVVISERVSKDLFAGANPLGEMITIRDSVTLTVTGVMQDMPLNTQLHTDFLASFSTLGKLGEDLNTWPGAGSSGAYTYLLLPVGASPATVDEKLPGILAGHMGDNSHNYQLNLQPLESLYLNSHWGDELGPTGSMTEVYLFSAISLLLVLMACFNYVNLSTSRVYHRHREIVVRSTAGASKSQLFAQFLSESVLLTSISMAFGLVLYELSIPYLEMYVGKSLDVSLSNNIFVWLAAPTLVFCVGVLSGSYPAAMLLRLRPKGVVSNRPLMGSLKSKLRRSLVVVQAFIAIGLVGFTAGIQRQLSFIEAYDYGFNPHNVWLVEFDEEATDAQKQRLKHEFQNVGLADVTLTASAPGESVFRGTIARPAGRDESEAQFLNTFTGDAEFGSTFGIQLVSGHRLSDEAVTNMPGAILINEAAADVLGLEEPIGAELSSSRGSLKVVGVVKDFLALSLHNKVMPSIINASSTSGRLLAAQVPENQQATMMPRMRDIWAGVFAGTTFDCRPLTEVMANCYSKEQKLISLFSLASGLAIVIACLGLLGLVSFTVERRTKEIGIRKSIGASVTSITRLLTGEFVVLVLVAGLIAWPVTNYAVSGWLENFVFRTEYGLSTYALVVAGVLILSLCTVGIQVIRAATANPVEALRHE
jgi:putative ABC transport system permease protein